MKQTAVMQLIIFILVERRQEDGSIKFHAHEDFNRFLQMEKEQMREMYEHAMVSLLDTGHGEGFDEYYNKTFKSE